MERHCIMSMMTIVAANAAGLWKRCQFKSVLRLVILMGCTVVVVIQLKECFTKLISPPISTNTHSALNKTLTYPAVTICRSPPYKPAVVKEHNLGEDIRLTSEWKNFPFGNVTLQEFWNSATYRRKEFISLYALNQRADNVNITSNMFFLSGQCHTLLPQTETMSAGRLSGYSILLKHSLDEINAPPLLVELGWNIYLHDAREVWSENRAYSTGREEAMFLEVGEQLHVKVAAQDFRMINDRCNPDPSYSFNKCEDLCHWRYLVEEVGCGAPWLTGINATHCNTYDTVRHLIVDYLNEKCPGSCCDCKQPCHNQQYSSYIINRKPMSALYPNYTSQLYIFYSSNLVTLIEEQTSYDWSLFLSDIGASLGFLLGISVLGIIDVIDRLMQLVLRRKAEKKPVDSIVAVIPPHKF